MPIKSLSDKDYLQLLSKLVDQQYDDAVEDYDIDKMEWIPSEPEIKQKVKTSVYGMIDLTNVKSNKIKEEILKCTNLKVSNFKIRIVRYHGESNIAPINNPDLCLDIEVMEERNQTPNGYPCKIDHHMIFSTDSRFKDCSWLKYFDNKNTTGYTANKIPIDTVVEIVRWMQIIKKLSAFV